MSEQDEGNPLGQVSAELHPAQEGRPGVQRAKITVHAALKLLGNVHRGVTPDRSRVETLALLMAGGAVNRDSGPSLWQHTVRTRVTVSSAGGLVDGVNYLLALVCVGKSQALYVEYGVPVPGGDAAAVVPLITAAGTALTTSGCIKGWMERS